LEECSTAPLVVLHFLAARDGQVVGGTNAALGGSITLFPQPTCLGERFEEIGGQEQEGLVDVVAGGEGRSLVLITPRRAICSMAAMTSPTRDETS
jgi:hypothetical protein